VLTTNKTPFYVDFVIKFKDGRIGLFDPHGTQFSDFGSKSDGLQKYIKEENKIPAKKVGKLPKLSTQYKEIGVKYT